MKSFLLIICTLLYAACLFAQQPTASEILTGMTPNDKMKLIRKHAFVNSAMANLVSISDNEMLFNKERASFFPLYFNPDTMAVLTEFYENKTEQLIREYMDVPPALSLNALLRSIATAIKSGKQQAALVDPPVPTNDEIRILKLLWQEDIATSSDIYVALDSTTLSRNTSEDVQKLLQQMTSRGFLGKKQVSPANEFSIFGLAKIEMSAKNRRNKLFIYWPLISRERLIALLDTRRYNALAQYAGNKTADQELLEQKLIELVR